MEVWAPSAATVKKLESFQMCSHIKNTMDGTHIKQRSHEENEQGATWDTSVPPNRIELAMMITMFFLSLFSAITSPLGVLVVSLL
ncbi:hypothetical protein HUJ04_011018 [Dendroctonus ponderosae]|nr:hypothetical protein HUJ04_011018 [Dendroctonus ponderosae]